MRVQPRSRLTKTHRRNKNQPRKGEKQVVSKGAACFLHGTAAIYATRVRKITAARIRLAKRAPGGVLEEVGEVLFSRIPVRSESDYRCLLKGLLDLQQAKELAKDMQQHQNKPEGEAAGYIWRR